MLARRAALLFALVAAIAVLFQLALAAGAPWGAYAMGGAYPGRFPPGLRVAAVVQAGMLAAFAGVVLSRAGVALPKWSRASRKLVWVVVVFSGVSAVLNLITPSARERAIWAPVGVLMFASSLIVARKSPP